MQRPKVYLIIQAVSLHLSLARLATLGYSFHDEQNGDSDYARSHHNIMLVNLHLSVLPGF